MADMKECFGQCANIDIHYREMSNKHFLRVDEEKLIECNECPLFARCMFLRYNKLLSDVLEILDSNSHNKKLKLG